MKHFCLILPAALVSFLTILPSSATAQGSQTYADQLDGILVKAQSRSDLTRPEALQLVRLWDEGRAVLGSGFTGLGQAEVDAWGRLARRIEDHIAAETRKPNVSADKPKHEINGLTALLARIKLALRAGELQPRVVLGVKKPSTLEIVLSQFAVVQTMRNRSTADLVSFGALHSVERFMSTNSINLVLDGSLLADRKAFLGRILQKRSFERWEIYYLWSLAYSYLYDADNKDLLLRRGPIGAYAREYFSAIVQTVNHALVSRPADFSFPVWMSADAALKPYVLRLMGKAITVVTELSLTPDLTDLTELRTKLGVSLSQFEELTVSLSPKLYENSRQNIRRADISSVVSSVTQSGLSSNSYITKTLEVAESLSDLHALTNDVGYAEDSEGLARLIQKRLLNPDDFIFSPKTIEDFHANLDLSQADVRQWVEININLLESLFAKLVGISEEFDAKSDARDREPQHVDPRTAANLQLVRNAAKSVSSRFLDFKFLPYRSANFVALSRESYATIRQHLSYVPIAMQLSIVKLFVSAMKLSAERSLQNNEEILYGLTNLLTVLKLDREALGSRTPRLTAGQQESMYVLVVQLKKIIDGPELSPELVDLLTQLEKLIAPFGGDSCSPAFK